MTDPPSSIRMLRSRLAEGAVQPLPLTRQVLAKANQNRLHNTYLWRNPDWTLAEAARSEAIPRGEGGEFGDGRPILWGLPISVKDCFDLAGASTTCGVTLYQHLHGIATRDSWLVEQLRHSGAVIVGKTHLHPLAYGITGENPEFGDCSQPGDAGALTGGSSSGAAASVMEGSAIAAIGTDTGGSIRIPAALCGLAGFRASLGRGNWEGAAHLAPSFDTMGWLFADLESTPLLASIFADRSKTAIGAFTRFATVGSDFLYDCEPGIVAGYQSCIAELQALGLEASEIDVSWWRESAGIYAPIQAFEAAQIHHGHFDKFQPAIRDRLEWGATISQSELDDLRRRHESFRARMDDAFSLHELILLPAAPVSRLARGEDHSSVRSRFLRYTTPFSLAGVPVVTIPGSPGGMQLAAARQNDEALAHFAALWGARRQTFAP